MPKCVFCGGEVIKAEVTFTYEQEGEFLIIENAPAEICTNCGEKMYSPDVTDTLLRLARTTAKPTRKIEVPVYDFAANE